jgi:hypothetical protein
MRSSSYLNTVLTVIAVLLGLNLWTAWHGGDLAPTPGSQAGDTEAAFDMHGASPAYAQGIPNAGQQRLQMIRELEQIQTDLAEFRQMFTAGTARVRVEMPEADAAN